MSSVLKLGLRAFDPAEMGAFLQDLLPAQPARTRTRTRRLNEAWARPRVRRSLNYALAFGLLSVMILPPLVRNGLQLTQLPTFVQQVFSGKDGSGAPTKHAPHPVKGGGPGSGRRSAHSGLSART